MMNNVGVESEMSYKKLSCRHPNCIRNEKYVTNIIDVQLRPFSCEQNVQQSAIKKMASKGKVNYV